MKYFVILLGNAWLVDGWRQGSYEVRLSSHPQRVVNVGRGPGEMEPPLLPGILPWRDAWSTGMANANGKVAHPD